MKAYEREKRKIIQYCLKRLHDEELLAEQRAIQKIKVFQSYKKNKLRALDAE
jgi:hypothetical protein